MAKGKKVNKITEKELVALQEKVQGINKLQMQVGALEMQKLEVVSIFNKLREEMETMQSDLTKSYGDVSISLSDGTITDADNS